MASFTNKVIMNNNTRLVLPLLVFAVLDISLVWFGRGTWCKCLISLKTFEKQSEGACDSCSDETAENMKECLCSN